MGRAAVTAPSGVSTATRNMSSRSIRPAGVLTFSARPGTPEFGWPKISSWIGLEARRTPICLAKGSDVSLELGQGTPLHGGCRHQSAGESCARGATAERVARTHASALRATALSGSMRCSARALSSAQRVRFARRQAMSAISASRRR